MKQLSIKQIFITILISYLITSYANSEINPLDTDPFRTAVPNVSDISIVSNTVVYDAAGNPSVTLIFKVKNSSGETLKGMNAKVELI